MASDPADLRPGAVVLVQGAGLLDALIEWATVAPVSHAAIVEDTGLRAPSPYRPPTRERAKRPADDAAKGADTTPPSGMGAPARTASARQQIECTGKVSFFVPPAQRPHVDPQHPGNLTSAGRRTAGGPSCLLIPIIPLSARFVHCFGQLLQPPTTRRRPWRPDARLLSRGAAPLERARSPPPGGCAGPCIARSWT